MQTEFLPIQNIDLASNAQLSFDLYVSLPLNSRVVLFRRSGEVLQTERMEKLALWDSERGDASSLLIRKEDYAKFVAYVSARLKNLLDVGGNGENSEVVTKAVRGMLSGTFASQDPAVVRSMMDNLNEISTVVIDGVLGEISEHGRKTYRSLVHLAANGTDFQKHPVNVASLAVMMAYGSGYSSKKTLGDVSIAALLHDVGLAKLPAHLALRAHRKENLRLDESVQINRHIKHSLEVIQEKNFSISALTKTMIEQHHELHNGKGHPKNLRGLQVSPFAQILHMADEIDQQVFGAGAKAVNTGLKTLFDEWTRERAFEPKLLQKVRALFFSKF